MSIYLKDFTFPTDEQETKFLWPPSLTPDEVRRCVKRDYRARNHNKSIYPFQILSKYNCQKLFFSDITILFGENGCGKSTALNVMAEKLGLKRETRYNSGRFFPDYLEMCNYNLKRNQDDNYRMTYHENFEMQVPEGSRIITSDDVFSLILKTREYNSEYVQINELLEKELKNREYESNIDRILAEKSIRAELKKNMLTEKQEYSNGQKAIDFFINSTENNALYILDEPENSLSIDSQIQLSKYIESVSKYFLFTNSYSSNEYIFAFANPAMIGECVAIIN